MIPPRLNFGLLTPCRGLLDARFASPELVAVKPS